MRKRLNRLLAPLGYMSAAVRAATLERLRANGYSCVVEGTDTIAWRAKG